MELAESEAVDPQLVAKSCFTQMRVRISKHDDLITKIAESFMQEWKNAGGADFIGIAAPHGSIIGLGLPEIKPGRMASVTRLTEMMFAIDSDIASKQLIELDPTTSAEPQEFLYKRRGADSANDIHDWDTPKKQLWAKLLLEVLDADYEQGRVAIEALDRYRHWWSAKKAEHIEDWDEWMAYRFEDGACPFFLTLTAYACELDLTQDEIDSVSYITWSGMAATVLSNDVYSFEVEAVLERQTSESMNNGIWRLMKQRDITVSEAKYVLVSEKLLPLEKHFMDQRAIFLENNRETSPILCRFLDLVEYLVSGNIYWGSQSPRYHNWREKLSAESATGADLPLFDETTAKCKDYIDAFPSGDTKNITEEVNAISLEDTKASVSRLQTESTQCTDIGPNLTEKFLSEPVQYLQSLSSKNVRGLLIEALSSWLDIPQDQVAHIEGIISDLHCASLLLDDIEDESPLRRGKPAAYRIFGIGQTINAANFLYVTALSKVMNLKKESQHIFLDELRKLHVGQSYDIHWTQTVNCPSLPEYIQMCNFKTGGLFSMIGRLMSTESEKATKFHSNDLTSFLTLLGQLFQIRDDYVNLASEKYEQEKGFAEDLDEGKFSFPLIHVLQHSKNPSMIRNVLLQRSRDGKMPSDIKELILQEMRDTGSLEFTKHAIHLVASQAKQALSLMEKKANAPNYMLQYLIVRLLDI